MSVNKTLDLIENNLPKVKEKIVEDILQQLKGNIDHSSVKNFIDQIKLLSDIQDVLISNMVHNVDLSLDDDIDGNIFWTDDLLENIENYIKPDEENYFKEKKK